LGRCRERTDQSPESAPAWLLWPVRAVAVVVVLPFRLLGMAVAAIGRFLHRYLIVPLAWLGHHAIVVPATWLWHYLIVVPLTWLWAEVLLPPARWLGKALVTVFGWLLAIPVMLIGVPLMWLWEHAVVPGARLFHRWILRPLGIALAAVGGFLWTWVLAPVGRAIAWFLRLGWQGTSWLFRQIYRFLLRPIGIAVAVTWHYTFGAVWRHVIAPTGRWLRDEILRPTGAAIRSVLSALGLR
jgi:hypothetical protein